ncbi:uncharacterized protein K460DRAFT_182756 [Cucurbitaria berberidis CBS 394.84]|uniref:Uncharacterized protein n=1 Tax=Cucurbitaria berberidis CBS 394.84 TaxID=1168544 RepID=A0A9P4GB28_9PLEO|nr:uncharacterized protein K460DRAFT_182756 [Cucurbitaria berberidis CBS 394.84]KAF1842342.1 hypothetical protein K460DRAFT_182756 [Cucurbitaria berberidis CBS 394.84]
MVGLSTSRTCRWQRTHTHPLTCCAAQSAARSRSRRRIEARENVRKSMRRACQDAQSKSQCGLLVAHETLRIGAGDLEWTGECWCFETDRDRIATKIAQPTRRDSTCWAPKALSEAPMNHCPALCCGSLLCLQQKARYRVLIASPIRRNGVDCSQDMYKQDERYYRHSVHAGDARATVF